MPVEEVSLIAMDQWNAGLRAIDRLRNLKVTHVGFTVRKIRQKVCFLLLSRRKKCENSQAR